MAEVQVAIPKAGRSFTITEEMYQAIPDEVFQEIFLQGAKVVLNRGQSKLSSTAKMGEGPGKEKEQNAIMAVVDEQWSKVVAGEIRITGGKVKRKSADREVHTEAMRQARLLVKDALKRDGIKPATVPAKEITEAAEQFLAEGSEEANDILEKARDVVEARKLKQAKVAEKVIKVNVSGIKADPKLVAKAEEAKARKKKPAKDAPAGVVAKAKPKAQHVSH